MKKLIFVLVTLMTALVAVNSYAVSECSVSLNGQINSQTSGAIIQAFRDVESTPSCEKVTLYIHSDGGELDSTLAVMGVMSNMQKDVDTFCLGYCGSAASLLLAAGTGVRSAYSTAVVMIHQMWSPMPDAMSYTEFEEKYERFKKNYDGLAEMYVTYTKLSKEEYLNIIESQDLYEMSAAEAQKLGFIDRILPGTI